MDSFIIGLILAVLSTFLIGISYVIKKKGLLRLSIRGLRAGNGGFGYLKDWMWWIGMLLMTSGEVLNFVAYSFAPATLVTPLGAISVLVTAISSSLILKEKLNLLGKLGCILCITGAVSIILNAPQESSVKSFMELKDRLSHQGFLIYGIVAFMCVAFLIFCAVPKWGQKTPIVYILITGIIGSLTVINCKGLGIGIQDFFLGHSILSDPIFWLIAVSLLCFISLQLTFLNRALDLFNVSVVTPILYVVFTTMVLVSSSIVFTEMAGQDITSQMGLLAGLVTVVVGIFLINSFQTIVLETRMTDLLFGFVNTKSAFRVDPEGFV